MTNSTQSGTYVSIDVTSIKIPAALIPRTGKVLPKEKQHVTLIYSEKKTVPVDEVRPVLKKFKAPIETEASEVDLFDNPDDENTVSLVLKIKSDELNEISNALIDLGLKHSYDDVNHHISIAYGVDRTEAKKIKARSGGYLPIKVELDGFKVEPIKDNWGETL